jgi:hypothetical protein
MTRIHDADVSFLGMERAVPEVFGYIYRITHPSLRLIDPDDGSSYQPCYIGRTEKTVESRFRDHQRDARKKPKEDRDGDGKLHSIMWAMGPDNFVVEEIDRAATSEELSKKERHWQEKYDSINKGWNKISASTINRIQRKSLSINFDGKDYSFSSIAELCRSLGISNSTLSYWVKKKGLSLQEAVLKSRLAVADTAKKAGKPILIFRRPYKTLNDAIRDTLVNKHGLSRSVISARLKKGMSFDEAFSQPSRKRSDRFSVRLPSGEKKDFNSMAEAHKDLSKAFPVPPYSTLVSYVSKGMSAEQAFGFEKRPWELELSDIDQLIVERGYSFIGKRNAQSEPVIFHELMEIFSSKKEFARVFGLDYTTVVHEFSSGLSPADILRKRDHPALHHQNRKSP